MKQRPTNAVILEKIKYLHDDVKEIKTDVKANTEFRLKAKGIIGAVSFVAVTFGGFIMWLINKFGGSK